MEEEEVPNAVPLSSHHQSEPVGVTVITGYLGAGKSTLVNYILTAQHGKRIAVILNEFGDELGVERAMINEDSGALVEEWIELPNGCVCCSVKHSLVQALEQLVERRERFDHVLLETTGLANPGPVASVLWVDEQLESPVRLDSIVTVVDAMNLQRQLDESPEAEAYLQIAYADVVILNKVDLVDGFVLSELRKKISSINSIAEVVEAVRCEVDLAVVVNRKAYDTKHSVTLNKLEGREEPGSEVHDKAVRTISITNSKPVILEKVNHWLDELLWEKEPLSILRMKAVLHVHGSEDMHILQSVRDVYEILPGRVWRPDEERCNKIVIIGRDLDKKSLEASFLNCSTSV